MAIILQLLFCSVTSIVTLSTVVFVTIDIEIIIINLRLFLSSYCYVKTNPRPSLLNKDKKKKKKKKKVVAVVVVVVVVVGKLIRSCSLALFDMANASSRANFLGLLNPFLIA